MKIDLQLIGVPLAYRKVSPYSLSLELRLDAFPTQGNLDALSVWLELVGDVTPGAPPERDWADFIQDFVQQSESLSLVPLLLPSDRRNSDEHVRSYLQVARRRVRDYLDGLQLFKLPIHSSDRTYLRKPNSWSLLSQLKFHKFSEGLAIGKKLELDKRWIRIYDNKHRATWTWAKWIKYGYIRVGWSANSSGCWLWYEITCPEFPGASGYYRNRNQQIFDEHVDDIWLPLVHNMRWWSANNPKLWNF